MEADGRDDEGDLPIRGGPKMDATPWQKREKPSPLTSRLSPKNSMTRIVHNESFAAIMKPKNTKARTIKTKTHEPGREL